MYSKVLALRFPKKMVNEPIAATLVKKFDLSFNILRPLYTQEKKGLWSLS